MTWNKKINPLLIFLCLGIFSAAEAQSIRWVPNGSFSRRTGTQSQFWESGFSAGLNAYLPLSRKLAVGIRAGFSYWSPDGYQMMSLAPSIRMRALYTNRIDTVNSVVDWPDIAGKDSLDYENLFLYKSKTGETTIIEIIPSVRWVALGDMTGEMSLSIQIGGGLFIIDQNASAVGQYGPRLTTVSVDKVSGVKPGFQLSLPVSMKNRLELQPIWSFILVNDDPVQYFSLSLGFVF